MSVADIGDKQLKKNVIVAGLVDKVVQTGGPTIFALVDGTGNLSLKGFISPGERAYPEIDAGDYIIRISGQYGGFRSDNAAYTTRKITEVLNWGKTCFYWWAYMFTDQSRLTRIPDIIAYDFTESSKGPAPATAKKSRPVRACSNINNGM